MDSQAIALFIAAGGLVLGLARLIVSILSYRLDSHHSKKNKTPTNAPDVKVSAKTKLDQR